MRTCQQHDMNNDTKAWDLSSSQRDVGQFLSVDSDPFQESPYLFHLWHANWINVGMQTYLQGWLLPPVPPPEFSSPSVNPLFLCHSLFCFFSLCSFLSSFCPQSIIEIFSVHLKVSSGAFFFLFFYSLLLLLIIGLTLPLPLPIFYITSPLSLSLCTCHPPSPRPLPPSSSPSPQSSLPPIAATCVVLNAGTWSWLIF